MSRKRRPRTGPIDRLEVEGFLEGLTLRVAKAAPADRARHTPSLSEARHRLERDDLAGAEAVLIEIDGALDTAEGEPELSEFPRGLVSYVATGDRGHPTPDEEEPTANRIRLVARLIEVRRADGRSVEPWVQALTAARDAYAQGDRREARRICDAVLRVVEAETGGRPSTEV
ncbi:MAG: hypothetical protein L3J73_04475 [Thermoplasmata archaeon]|nr:hypothetical protein [Thermoplasmata archaeon]